MSSNSPSNSWQKYSKYIKVHPTAIIDPVATINIPNLPEPPSICLEIGAFSHIFSNITIQRPDAKVKIGKYCQLGSSSIIAAKKIVIGDDVLMAWGCTIMDNDSHSLSWQDRQYDARQGYKDYLDDKSNFTKHKNWHKVSIKPIQIKNKAWLGFNVTVLKGVTIGQESVVGAASVVTKNVLDKTVVAGNPAKLIRLVP